MPHTGQPDTEELLNQAAHGDQAASQLLLVRHHHRLRQMVAARMDARLAGRLDPSDIVQEALIEAVRKLPRYLAERPLPFYPWLRQIAWERLEHEHARHITAKKRSVAREEAPHLMLSDRSVLQLARRLIASGTSPTAQFLRQELRHSVRDALARLSERDREVLVLRFLEELSPDEIAAIQGVSVGAVKVRQVRALKRLQSLLEGDSGEDRP
jgi:RNA polymerase sigma-70 factor (ECF subfamily)